MKISLKISLIILFIIFILSPKIFAFSGLIDTGKNWVNTGNEHKETTMNTDKIKETSELIYNIFFGVGIAVAIIVGAILGIQFMTAGVNKKVEVKEALVPYAVSCIVVFGSFGIWKLVVTILNGAGL